jgi:hypothetical protein
LARRQDRSKIGNPEWGLGLEKSKFNPKNSPTAEGLAILEEHEEDLTLDADEGSVSIGQAEEEDITGIETYQGSVAVRAVAAMER